MISWTEERGVGTLQRDSSPLTIRPIRPRDLDLIMEMHGRLSTESIRARYLGPYIPTRAAINSICHLAPEMGAGFVATVREENHQQENGQQENGQEGSEMVIGLAHYVRETQAQVLTAEVGILVEDQFQGQGIGRRFWQTLHQDATAKQIVAFRLLCEPNNRRMARLVHGSGLPYQAKVSYRLREYLVSFGLTSTTQN